jgi:hypothetical protein
LLLSLVLTGPAVYADDDDDERDRPRASFVYAPEKPFAGDEVVLTSTSTSEDGEIDEHEWDLDGDGEFDDAEGEEVRTSFAQPGSYVVGLRVRDDRRRSRPFFDTIEVSSRPDPGTSPPGTSPPGTGPSGDAFGPRLLNPFPRVRIRGVTTPTGARIDLLSVLTPGGTRVLVRCKGRGCPWRRKIRKARFGTTLARTVRIPGFRRRHLRAGTVLQVFVTRRGMIGKYTRFRIRRMKAPLRVDRCTAPGAARAARCPG